MSVLDMIEMVCDWTAMSQELGQGGSARQWADKNIGVRWKFDKAHADMIYNMIDWLDEKNGVTNDKDMSYDD
jgi:hypothetical protein